MAPAGIWPHPEVPSWPPTNLAESGIEIVDPPMKIEVLKAAPGSNRESRTRRGQAAVFYYIRGLARLESPPFLLHGRPPETMFV